MTSGKNAPVLRPIVLVADEAILETMRMELADAAPLRVKAVPTMQEALAAIPTAQPHAILIQNGKAQPRQLMIAKQISQLAASRKVPIVIFGGPLDPALEVKRNDFGIAEVVDGAYLLAPVLEALKSAIGKIDALRRTDQIRRKIASISQNLKPYQAPEGGEAEPAHPDAQALPKDDIPDAQALPKDDFE
ncbi:MAG: hypothetical protein KF696_13095 [Planctomycetes bacterium]|nr:hypothetical protein [Planctomycetota bacterium]MCW8135493.1 hypothetical protein [Planctomycetota bacterium]